MDIHFNWVIEITGIGYTAILTAHAKGFNEQEAIKNFRNTIESKGVPKQYESFWDNERVWSAKRSFNDLLTFEAN